MSIVSKIDFGKNKGQYSTQLLRLLDIRINEIASKYECDVYNNFGEYTVRFEGKLLKLDSDTLALLLKKKAYRDIDKLIEMACKALNTRGSYAIS